MIEEKHQDYIYLKENYYDNPKEIFIFLGKLIDKCSLKNNILDIGCARGEFLYYLNKIFTETKFTGIDYSKNLIDEAKKIYLYLTILILKILLEKILNLIKNMML